MKEVSIYTAPLGSLISWTDYIPETPVPHVGILVKVGLSAGIIEVISNGTRHRWWGFQCEVIA